VPFNSFAEYAPEPNPVTRKKDVVWFGRRRVKTRIAGLQRSRQPGPQGDAM
jgi:hypothetical protein